MKHTKGPWVASQYMDTSEWGVLSEKNEIIVGVCSGLSKADAALIAAAPELLEALKDLLKVVELDVARNGGPGGAFTALKAAREVIARAEGSQE
jgi:hypothetical protein